MDEREAALVGQDLETRYLSPAAYRRLAGEPRKSARRQRGCGR
jgi:hypothetical protein